jgi:NAD(P)-dependent dehydrogenase (short-subunit alcohol dehydrogenase family)
MSTSKVALITGAYRGLGYEVAMELLEKGYEVFITARREEEGRKASEKLAKGGGKARFIPLDVTDSASTTKAAKDVAGKVDHLDVLINNAGVFPDGDRTILNVSEALMKQSFTTNTVGAVLVSQAFWPLLAKSKNGRIINVSSGLGALGEMGAAAPSYSVSKTALNAVTRQLAAALKDKHISVNSVCPGWVRTEMGGSNAPRSVEEGASGIVWLATEAPADFTGNFVRDGKVIPW